MNAPDNREVENRLLLEKQRFEALFKYATMGILVTNDRGAIVMANSFVLKEFGYREEEMLGKSVEQLIPDRFHEGHTRYRDTYYHHPETRPMGAGRDLFAVRKNNSEFPVEISLSPFRTSEGLFVIAFIVDISVRKEKEYADRRHQEEMAVANEAIKKLNEELEAKVTERTQRLEKTLHELEISRDEISQTLEKEKELNDLKSRFVSMASHEFRTPLSTILSSASLLAKYTLTEEQPKRDKHIQRIKSSVNNLTGILNEFLSIGRIEDGKLEAHFADFNLPELLTAVCTEMEEMKKPGQVIRYHHEGGEQVSLDIELLRNVLINLLSNAIKFSPENAAIEVNSIVRNGGHITISLKDEGMGIPPEDQEHLFERFFRGKNVINIQGTGLGLHIVGKYIELMQGTISYTSELNKGTEFILNFKL